VTVDRLALKNFTVFQDASLAFVPGVNVLIGENGTGKSQVLKMIYVFLTSMKAEARSGKIGGKQQPAWHDLDAGRFADRINMTFMMDGPDEVIREGAGEFRVELEIGENSVHASFNDEGSGWLGGGLPAPLPNAVLIPPHEVLSFSEGFVSLYDAREVAFDVTVRDLVALLEKPRLRVPQRGVGGALLPKISKVIGGTFVPERGRFYLQVGTARRQASLIAEGLRKLGVLQRLLEVGALSKGGVLLWDEPEANLNPKLTALVCDVLLELARQGVQVIVTTHDYLIARTLSQAVEFAQTGTASVRFLSLHHEDSEKPVNVEIGETLADIRHDSLLDAFTEFHDRGMRLATSQSVRPPKRAKRTTGKSIRGRP
jgi:ABC-type polar amino acid transport system ATPase subunit